MMCKRLMRVASINDSDQTARKCRLLWIIAACQNKVVSICMRFMKGKFRGGGGGTGKGGEGGGGKGKGVIEGRPKRKHISTHVTAGRTLHYRSQ